MVEKRAVLQKLEAAYEEGKVRWSYWLLIEITVGKDWYGGVIDWVRSLK